MNREFGQSLKDVVKTSYIPEDVWSQFRSRLQANIGTAAHPVSALDLASSSLNQTTKALGSLANPVNLVSSRIGSDFDRQVVDLMASQQQLMRDTLKPLLDVAPFGFDRIQSLSQNLVMPQWQELAKDADLVIDS